MSTRFRSGFLLLLAAFFVACSSGLSVPKGSPANSAATADSGESGSPGSAPNANSDQPTLQPSADIPSADLPQGNTPNQPSSGNKNPNHTGSSAVMESTKYSGMNFFGPAHLQGSSESAKYRMIGPVQGSNTGQSGGN